MEENKDLMIRSLQRRDLAKQAEEKMTSNLFGKPTPGGESMMLHTRQCPECQVGQAGPVGGKPGVWQCSVCGSTYNTHSKGGVAEQTPYDAKFYGGPPFLSWPSEAAHRNTASVQKKLTRRADFRGAVSQFCIDVRDAVNGTGDPADKKKVGDVLNSALKDGDLYGAVSKVYTIEEVPVENVEVTSEEGAKV